MSGPEGVDGLFLVRMAGNVAHQRQRPVGDHGPHRCADLRGLTLRNHVAFGESLRVEEVIRLVRRLERRAHERHDGAADECRDHVRRRDGMPEIVHGAPST